LGCKIVGARHWTANPSTKFQPIKKNGSPLKSSERLATFEHLDDRVFCESGNQDWKGSPCLVLVVVPAEQGAGEMVPRAGGQERGRVCKIMIAD